MLKMIKLHKSLGDDGLVLVNIDKIVSVQKYADGIRVDLSYGDSLYVRETMDDFVQLILSFPESFTI